MLNVVTSTTCSRQIPSRPLLLTVKLCSIIGTVISTSGMVGGWPYLSNASRATIRSQAKPAKLMLAAARHVVTPSVLFDAILTIGALFELGCILQKLQKGNFLALARVAIVLLARSTLMPRAVMRKTSVRVTHMATHDRPSISIPMELARPTSFSGAPAKLGIFLYHESAYIFIVCLEGFFVYVFLYLS